MNGNVALWVWDENGEYSSSAKTDPLGVQWAGCDELNLLRALRESCREPIVRGGSYHSHRNIPIVYHLLDGCNILLKLTTLGLGFALSARSTKHQNIS